ncbi:MAG: hypothetical protein H7A36_07930 [Chlamydiales bacterium]|nr:hypothetical protein [Chlamydiales bacterium]
MTTPSSLALPSILTIFAFPEDNEEERVFQQVELLGDFFRVLLQEGERGSWIYFHSSNIEREAKRMFEGNGKLSFLGNWGIGRCADGGVYVRCVHERQS